MNVFVAGMLHAVRHTTVIDRQLNSAEPPTAKRLDLSGPSRTWVWRWSDIPAKMAGHDGFAKGNVSLSMCDDQPERMEGAAATGNSSVQRGECDKALGH